VIGDGSSSGITPATLADHADSQIDLMNAESLAKLNASASATAGTYNYAVLNWYTPIAVKATVTTPNGSVYTKPAASYESGYTQVAAGALSSSPAEETIVVSANGGSFFKFQTPFVISDADIAAGTAYTIDLVFNPEGVIAANDNSPNDGNLRDGTSSMYIPMLQVTPVPRKTADYSVKETYIYDLGTDGKYRVELYYNSGDATKAIQGATGGFVYDSTSSTGGVMRADWGAKVIEIADVAGALTLKIPSMSGGSTAADSIVGLTRKTTVGETGTSDLVFGGVSSYLNKTYTYEGSVDVR